MNRKGKGKTKRKTSKVKNPGFPAAFWKRIEKPETDQDIRDFNLLAEAILKHSAAAVTEACSKAPSIEAVLMILDGGDQPTAKETALEAEDEPMAMHSSGPRKYMGKTELKQGTRMRMAKIDTRGNQIDPDDKEVWDSIKVTP